MAQNIHEMLASRQSRRNWLKSGTAPAVLACSLLAASTAYAQEPFPAASSTGVAAPPSAGSQAPASAGGQAPASRTTPVTPPANQTGTSSFVDSLIPGFQITAALNLDETYATNSRGASSALAASGIASGPDWITLAGLTVGMNEHSARVSWDLNYSGFVDYYARGTQSTQFSNELQTVANVIAIPDYLNILGRAFAQPVVISNVGPTTASGISANGFRNAYGFSAGPDITFHLGDFANSDTKANYGAVYFTNLAGSTGITGIPGIGGPQNTTTRSASETLTAGTDFSRLNWSLVASLDETDRPQGLFADRSGIATLRYAISPEIALLGTGGYDAISNTTRLTRNLSGPVGMGGVELTYGEDFLLQVEAGQKYNDFSFMGNLRWNLSASASLTGSATDTVTTPEGGMLNNLGNLTASSNGFLTSGSNLYSSGLASSLGSFNAQPQGSPSYNQAISRVQEVRFGFADDFGREHLNLTAFGMRLTQLDGTFIGRPVNNSWGTEASFSHDLTRLMTATVGATYTDYQELGGDAGTLGVQGSLSYSLGPSTHVYFRTDYVTRTSSQSLQALSPFTGGFDDLRLTIGLTQTLL